jgi:multidrug efflux pump subunit AcrB
MGRKYTGQELASIVVLARPEGDVVTLDRLAHIDDGFTEDPIAATINGEPAVLLIVYKTPEEDALVISKTIQPTSNRSSSRFPKAPISKFCTTTPTCSRRASIC